MRHMSSHCEEEEWTHSTFTKDKNEEKLWMPHRCAGRYHVISTAKDFSIPFSTVLQDTARNYKYISISADVLGGTPRISGTRIPVYMILDAIDHYGNVDGALTSYPNLTKDQVSEAVSFAAEILEHPIDHKS